MNLPKITFLVATILLLLSANGIAKEISPEVIDAWRLNKTSWLLENIDSYAPDNESEKNRLINEINSRNNWHLLTASCSREKEDSRLLASYRFVFIKKSQVETSSEIQLTSRILEDRLELSIEQNGECNLISFSSNDVTGEANEKYEQLSASLSDAILNGNGKDRGRSMVKKAMAMFDAGKIKELYELLEELLTDYQDRKLERLAKHFLGNSANIYLPSKDLLELNKLLEDEQK